MSTTEDALPGAAARRQPARITWTRTTLRRHLRAALAAAILIPMQLFAAQGIPSACPAALAERDAQAQPHHRAGPEQTDPTSPAPPEQAEQADAHPQTGWLIEGTTTAAPSPLDLPRCTTSPDTHLPCLATIPHPNSKRAVVLEEDTSLTAFVRQ